MIRKFLIALAAICCTYFAQAQTFEWNGQVLVTDYTTDTVPIPVTGLGTVINSNFGISKVCFSANHSFKSDLSVSLMAPDGHSVLLIQGQGGDADHFTQTCLGMDGIPVALGAPPYTGLFLPMGDISSLNNGQNPNGIWKLLVSDYISPDSGEVVYASITFNSDPPTSGGLGGNNLGPAGPFIKSGVVCPGGAAGCDLLPDVTASAFEIASNILETPGSLRVSNGTPNIGYGPLEIFGIDSCFCDGVPSPCNVPCPGGAELQHIIRQRIYQKRPGTDTLGFYDRDAGAMTFHPEHGHLHVDHWADFTLRTATSDPDPRNWPIIGTSVKQSYCLVNLGTCAGKPGECVDNSGNTIYTVPNQGLGFYTGCGLNQGIYPGNWDVYSTNLNEPILLDNVCNGNYYIVSITDPNNRFLESDETNNWVAVPITLTKQNIIPVITSSSSTMLCNGDSIVLTSNIAPNYLWSTGDTSRSIVVRTPGTYTVSTSCGTSTNSSTPFTITHLPAEAAAAVSIARTSGAGPVCEGTSLTFTATPVYGGTAPTYQWKVDNVNAGTNSPIFTSSTLTNGQKITCSLRSDISCFTAAPVHSDTLTAAVIPAGDPAITISQTRGTNTLCQGDTASFKAIVVNGDNISYQWKLNGLNVGTNTDVYTNNNFSNSQSIRCDITAGSACPKLALIGKGTALNTATSSMGAAYPTYYGNARQQHLILASELSEAGLTAGNITTMGFNIGSTVGDPVSMKGFTIKMTQVTAPELTLNFINPAMTTVFGPVEYVPQINAMNTHQFITPFYWDGVSAILVDICFEDQVYGRKSYQNPVSITPFYSTAYFQTDATTPAAACGNPVAVNRGTLRPNFILSKNAMKTIASDSIVLSVNSAQPPAISIKITKGDSLQCAGSSTTFKAVPNNTGANPIYQWTKNGQPINGETAETFTSSSLAHNDTIRCKMTAGLTCGILQNVISNPVVIKLPLPVYTFTGNGNWNIAGNWANNAIPPATLLSCSEIIINPANGGECYLAQQQVIAPGAKLTVNTGKKFRVQGNVLIRQ